MGTVQVLLHEPTRKTFRQVSRTSINIASSGDNTILTPSTGKALRILWIGFLCNAAVNIILNEGTSAEGQTAMTGVMNFNANGSLTWDFRGRDVQLPLAQDKSFVINLSGAKQVSGIMLTYEVD